MSPVFPLSPPLTLAQALPFSLRGSFHNEGPATASLAESPVAVAAIAGAWASTGLIAAYVLHRRGHEFRTLAVLGGVFGPLFIGLAIRLVRNTETTEPIVLSAGGEPTGAVDVVVALDGSTASPAALRSALQMFGARLGRIALARAIDFQSACDTDWSDAKAAAALELGAWASCVPGEEPAKVLVPGPPGRALPDYAVREGYDLLILAGGWGASLLQGRGPAVEASRIPVLIVPPPASPRQPADREQRPTCAPMWEGGQSR